MTKLGKIQFWQEVAARVGVSEQAFEDCISRNESTIAELQAVARQREAEVAALRGRVAAADAAASRYAVSSR